MVATGSSAPPVGPPRMKVFGTATVALLGLSWAVAPALAGDADRFEVEVRPLLAAHCVKCHGAEKQKGGLRLDAKADALKGGDTGPAFVPGKPADSLLVKAVRHEADLEMPPGKRLSDEQIATLADWIKDGAAWPDGGPKAVASSSAMNTRPPGKITDADKAWWAFQPPKRPAVPDAGATWAKTPVDRFVFAKLTAEGLAPAPKADKRTLVRRVTLDLTGLPPTPEEVEAFVTDPSPDAYEKLVDRLLASPAYGERMARSWLDLVRYADSDGYNQDAYRPNAWRYRDYVVRAMNADAGYDRFVKEQLAGDELFPGDPEAKLATGFLRLWPYEYNLKAARVQLDAIFTDITDVAGDALLGLGVQCARCHDHKFDPILQTDYYSLRSFFAGLRFVDEPVFPTPEAKAEYNRKRADWEAKTAAARAKVEAILGPARAKMAEDTLGRFPPDVQEAYRKPAADRTPGETQLAELVGVQVRYMSERDAEKKIPAAKKAEYAKAKAEWEKVSAGEPAAPVALIARDVGPTAAETVVPGGRKKSVEVGPTVLVVLGGVAPPITPRSDSSGRRAALAEWLTRPDHPLTARVMANRVWQQHFGRGIVATPSDFGTLGDKPTHPELLDWLATEFVENGWSLKKLHRLLVTSAVYRQASAGPQATESAAKDPENKWLARMPARRLDAEQVRDAMLAVGGELDAVAGGPGVAGEKPRRGVYVSRKRNTPDPLLAAFDAADGLISCPTRTPTVTPTQSLLLLNGDWAFARAAAFAKRVMPADGKDAPAGVEAAYRWAYGRPPAADEKAAAVAFLKRQLAQAAGGSPVDKGARLAAWTDFCHALLNSNEFLYVD
jgi:mono/diheme cytochrome c family protein